VRAGGWGERRAWRWQRTDGGLCAVQAVSAFHDWSEPVLLLERLWREGHVEQTDCATHPGGVVIHLNTITLQGGAIPTGGTNPNEYFLLPAKNGESLSKTELNVPGGLLNIVNCEEISNFIEPIA
jgi:hypothetical protein